MKWIVSLILVSQVAVADDLLSILESDGSSESFIHEMSELGEMLRKELGVSTAEQNIFVNFVDEKKFDKSLYQWNSAFAGSDFEKSPSGKALLSYLYFVNGLHTIGVENLFQVKEPEKIAPILQRLWRLAATREDPVWRNVQISWSPVWTKIFDRDREILVMSRTRLEPKEGDRILGLLKKTKLNTESRAWLEWQMALSLAVDGEVGKAAKVLAHLLNVDQKVVSQDLIRLTAARLLYERGYLDAAIKYYSQVQKTSEYWFVAQEEKAWSYLRKGQPQDAIAVVSAAVQPEFAAHVGPETVFLNSLAQLKICDYAGVAKSLVDFRERFRSRAKDLLQLQEVAVTPSTEKLFREMKVGPVTLIGLGSAAKHLPRYVSRDEHLMDLVKTWKALEGEEKVAGELYARSLSEGTGKVGFQAGMERIKQAVSYRVQSAKAAAYNLLKRRASEEVDEIHVNLQKMHIVEAELIQQTSLADRVVSATTNSDNKMLGTSQKQEKYDLRFPFEGERWFDEISNMKVDLNKACAGKRAQR